MPFVEEHRPGVVARPGTATASRAPRSGGSGSRTSSGERSASSFHTDSASGYSGQSQPSARARAITISRSPRAFPGQRHRGADAVDPPLRVRERAVLLGEARRGEDDVRVPARGLVQEEVLRDEELELPQPLLDVMRVRLRLGRVLADEVERLDPAVVEPRHHLVEPVAGALRQVDAPRGRELLAHVGVVPGLVAGEVVRVRARVVQALDVVLAAERVQAGRLVAEVAGHQDEVRERPDVVDAARVLGDPERVEDRRVPLGRVLAGGGPNRLGRNARHPFGVLGGVAGDDLAHRLEVLAVARRCSRRPGGPPRGSRA